MHVRQGDLGEYNQCQSQLRHLYENGLNGHPDEFLGYRILYLLHTRNRRGPSLPANAAPRPRGVDANADVNALLSALRPQERRADCVDHALQVRLALAMSNYHRLFKLYQSAPKMGAYLMDHFVPRERVQALSTMSRACGQGFDGATRAADRGG